jgi:hypothetical protein
MKITISVCRKEGRPGYGSEGASCEVTFELADELIDHRKDCRAAIERHYNLADDVVNRQLARHPSPAPVLAPEPPAPAMATTNGNRFANGNGRTRGIWGVNGQDNGNAHGNAFLRPELERGRGMSTLPPRDRNFAGDRPPQTGAQLCAWAKKQEERLNEKGLMIWLGRWGVENSAGSRVREWDSRVVRSAYQAALELVAEAEGRSS